MDAIRGFSYPQGLVPPTRTVDGDAPAAFRQEMVDVFFNTVAHAKGRMVDKDLYEVASQSLGIQAAGEPYSGYRHALGRDIARVSWERVYDLICRLWAEFERVSCHLVSRENANRVLSAHGIAWDLDDTGHLKRVIPIAAAQQVESAIRELDHAQFASAKDIFAHAVEAYDARPRRDRDACANSFDAMESVGKITLNLPTATFGQVLGQARAQKRFHPDVLLVLEALNTHRNHNYGHGSSSAFSLTSAEVDFTYLGNIVGLLLIARTP